MVDVFISYPRAQRDRVEPIREKLTALGLDVFFDLEGIDGGATFPDVIDRALRGSKAVLCAWSPLYFDRPWCLIECRNAKARELLVPVATEGFDPFAPPADLQGVNYYDLTGWKGEDAHENWNRTLQRLGRLVGRDLAPQLKAGLLGGQKLAEPAPEPPPEVEAKMDVLADLRATWANFPGRDKAGAVGRFLEKVRGSAPGSGLEFEVEHHLDELRRAAEAEEKARHERKAAERAKAEGEAGERKGRPGPEAARDYLIGLAKQGRTATYSEAAAALGCPMKALWELLDLTAVENQKRGEPRLCALIVNADGLPGRGYFRNFEPGLPEGGSERATAHAKMVREVLAHDWAREARSGGGQAPPAMHASPSATRWALIEKSLDPRDYEDFLEVFPNAPEAFEARRHRRQLADWAEVDQDASEAVSAFLKDPTKGADLFAALDEHAQKTMRRAAEAELKAKQEQEAAERAKAEAEARAQREWEERIGPEAVRAAWAAKAGKPVAERVYPVRLEGIPNWPNPNMVAIPPGRFLMGAAEGEVDATEDEFPQHEVRIDYPFALGQHTVTFAEWDAARAAGARLEKPDDEGWGRDKRPVMNVSWEDARGYLAWLNGRLGLEGRPDAYRLPSEAEWEYACRAGTETPFSFGDRINKSQAQFSMGNVGSAGQSVPVGSFPANAFGLCDMHGNVWEWCADHWHHDYNGAPLDGSIWDGGDASRRVLRGGAWFSTPRHLRSANRVRSNPTGRTDDKGFRVARTLSAPTP